MAMSVTPGAAGYVHNDSVGLEGLFTTRRKYDLSDRIVSLDRATAVFDYRLRQALKKIVVTDPEPKVLVRSEDPIKFTISADGADTTYEGDTLYISDPQAKWLQAGDVLSCPQIFCDSDGAAYSTVKYGQPAPEAMIVQTVVLSGSGTADVAKVTVLRGNGYNRSVPGATLVTTVLSEYTLVWQANSMPSGGNAPNSRDMELDVVQNYTQFFSKTTSEDEQYTNTNVYGKETFEQRFTRTRQNLTRQLEVSHFFGRKAKRMIGGKTAWMTGGIVEFIPDATTAIDGISRRFNMASTFSVQLFRKYMEVIFRYGNSRHRKWGFTGGKFFTEMETYLEKFLVLNDSITKALSIHVFELECGHGILELMRSSVLTEMSTSAFEYSLDMVIVDPDYVDLMVLQNMDVKTRMDIQDDRAHSREAEVYTQCGLYLTHPTAHGLIYGMLEAA